MRQLFIGSLVILIGLALLPHSAIAKDCTMHQYASLDLQSMPNGLLLVPVTLQGKPRQMILQTASMLSSISESAAQEMNLHMSALPSSAGVRFGTKLAAKVAIVHDLALGQVQYKTINMAVLPPDVGQFSGDVVGIIGMEVLQHLDIELDLARHKLNLYSQDHCPGQVVFWADAYDSVPIKLGRFGELYFPMELQGKKIETTLATENSNTVLFTDASRKLYQFDTHSTDIDHVIDNGGESHSFYRAMTVASPGLKILNARVQLVDPPAGSPCVINSHSDMAGYDGCIGAHPLKLGRNVLAKLHIFVALKEKVLYFTPADAHKDGLSASDVQHN